MDVGEIRAAGYEICAADAPSGPYASSVVSIWDNPDVLARDDVCYCFGPTGGWTGSEFLPSDSYVTIPSDGSPLHSIHAATSILSAVYNARNP